jgi:hypothetical protein
VLIPPGCHLLHGLRLQNDLLLGHRQLRLPLIRWLNPEHTLLLQWLLLQLLLLMARI